MQTPIPTLLMRGGTSRGPCFKAADPPVRKTLRNCMFNAANPRNVTRAFLLRIALLRTVRLIMRKEVMVPAAIWEERR